jgi:hypothetical protein
MIAPKIFFRTSLTSVVGAAFVGWNRNSSAGSVVGRFRSFASWLIRSCGTRLLISDTVKRWRRIDWDGRKLRNAKKGVRAIAISGLWFGSVHQQCPRLVLLIDRGASLKGDISA